MKKTVTTILSLAMAIIMVSSLSSGVILAKGPSDNASDQGKERARYHTVRDVGILICGMSPALPTATLLFGSFDRFKITPGGLTVATITYIYQVAN